MKNIIITIFCLAALLIPVAAHAQRPSERDREAWMKEMLQFKNDYLTKRLALTDEQKAKFIPQYNAMEEETRKVQEETEQLYRQTLRKGDKATDIEYEKAAEAAYELKGRENEIEMRYFNEFKQILTPAQLFKLKETERDFSRELMKQHRRNRAK